MGDLMTRIAVLIDDMFEDIEYTKPAEAFKKAGHEIINVGIKKVIVKGKKESTQVSINRTIEEVKAEDFDALFIPGGYSPDRLRADEEAVEFVKQFVKSQKPIFFICHGAQLLITADAIKGRKVTGYKSIIQDIKNAGAEFVYQKVVVDDNLVSSRNPGDLDGFIKASLEKLNHRNESS